MNLKQICENSFLKSYSLESKEFVYYDYVDFFKEDCSARFLEEFGDTEVTVWLQIIATEQLKAKYPNIDFKFYNHYSFDKLNNYEYVSKATKEFDEFLSCFNGADEVGRQFVTALLQKNNLWSYNSCSKNFVYSIDRIDGNLISFCGDTERFYRKFIISDTDSSLEFYNSKYVLDRKNQFNYKHNADVLLPIIERSWLNLVTESCSVSYNPWLTEKIVFPILAKTLWLAFAQPGYYAYIEKHLGFKKYDKIFDYGFDAEPNPVKRLIKLFETFYKFKNLTKQELHDLYLLEEDTIKYNYDHYRSKSYMNNLSIWVDELPQNL